MIEINGENCCCPFFFFLIGTAESMNNDCNENLIACKQNAELLIERPESLCSRHQLVCLPQNVCVKAPKTADKSLYCPRRTFFLPRKPWPADYAATVAAL